MTKERWNQLTRIEKHEFLYKKAREVYDFYVRILAGAENIASNVSAKTIITPKMLETLGIDSNGQSIVIQSSTDRAGYALPVLGRPANEVNVYYGIDKKYPNADMTLRHELSHAIQYIFEYHDRDKYQDINGTFDANTNLDWISIAAKKLKAEEFSFDLNTMFYYYDPIEPYAYVNQVEFTIDRNIKRGLPATSDLCVNYDKNNNWEKVYFRYKQLVDTYRSRMTIETSAPKNRDALKDNFTGLIMYMSVMDVSQFNNIEGNGLYHARLINPFLPKIYHHNPTLVFSMSDEDFRSYQIKTYNYICEVFNAFDIQVKKILAEYE